MLPPGSGSAESSARPARLRHRGGRALLLALRGTLSRRFASTLLLLAVASELVILGIGVSRKLERAYEQQQELARTHLAIKEAELLKQSLVDESVTEGSAGIGAAERRPTPGAADTPVQPSDQAPPLRPLDVASILLRDTGDLPEDPLDGLPSAGGMAGGERPDDTQDQDPNATTVVAEGGKLGAEDAAELDRLIRQGVAALTAGDMRRCILSLEQARTLDAAHPALLYYYGLAYDKLLNPNKAREYYTQVFHLRDKAGKYFQRASRRLTYGLEQPAAMRGKLAFGPHQLRHSYDEQEGERVNILLPVMLAPGEDIKPEDIYVTFQAFDLVNGRKIEFARLAKPQMAWENGTPTWQDWEENLTIEYAVPPLSPEEMDAYGDLKYYGFTAKLYYKGEPLDCLSSPSALILQEQRLLSRRAPSNAGGLLPDDGLDSLEEALPAQDFLNDIDPPQP